jgi:hypothetical protein
MHKLILGTASFGSRTDELMSRKVLNAWREAGYCEIDTANVYGAGQAEEIIAGFLTEHDWSEARITSKFGLVNNNKRFPKPLLNFARKLLSIPLIRLLKGFFFGNKKKSISPSERRDIANKLKLKFSKNFNGLCLHDPTVEEVYKFAKELNILRDEHGDIKFGFSLNTLNSQVKCDHKLLECFDFINIDCSNFCSGEIIDHADLRIHSVYSFLSSDKKESVNFDDLHLNSKARFLKQLLNNNNLSVGFIVDVKAPSRCVEWEKFMEYIGDE